MKNIIKKAITLLVICIFMAFAAAPAFALVDKTDDFYVADYADVLKDGTKKDIISQNETLYDLTGGQIVVVTVRYLESGYYADEYAVELFNSWEVGDREKHNGMLLLLVTEEDKGWLSQGAGIKNDFTNEDASDLLDRYFWKKFDNGDFDEAVSSLFPHLISWYEDYYNVDLSSSGNYVDGSDYDSGGNYGNDNGGFISIFGTFWRISKMTFLIIAVVVIIILCSLFGGRRRRRYYGRPPMGPGFGPGPRPPHYGPGPGFGPRPPRYGPGPGFGSRPPRSSGGFGSSRPSSGFRSGGGGRSSGGGGGRSGGFHSGGGGRSGGGGAGRR